MIYHILPCGDIKPHEESSTCDCIPEVIIESGNMIMVHNAYDGREKMEKMFDYKNLKLTSIQKN